MPNPIGTVSDARLVAAARRERTAPRPRNQFSEVLRTGADILLAGASAASGLVGGPLLSTAIQTARERLVQTSGSVSSGAPGPLGAATSGAVSRSVGVAGGTGAAASSEVEALRALQQQGRQENLEYLRLQQEVQQANRRISLASNLLKARHDTARAAINNMRA